MSALLTTVQLFARAATGGTALSHIAYGTFAVTIAAAPASAHCDVRCALLHDTRDGFALARLVAARLAARFCATYAAALPSLSALSPSAAVNITAFRGFRSHLVAAIRATDRDALAALLSVPGIANCLLAYDGSDSRLTAAAPVEEIGLFANLRSLTTFSDEFSLPHSKNQHLPTIQLILFQWWPAGTGHS